MARGRSSPRILANKTRKCYHPSMAVRTCKVTYRDADGVEHTAEVTAQSLFEAVAQALHIFREHDWSGEPKSGSASVVVTIKPAEVEHRVRIKDFQTWLESAPKSPAEMA